MYVHHWRQDLFRVQGLSLEFKEFLKRKVEAFLTDEFCTMCELNAVEGTKGCLLSWVIINERTYIFRRPNDNYLQIAILKEKISDFGNYIHFLKSRKLLEIMTDLGKEAHFAFAHHDGAYKWNNNLRY
jgi:hypothetical protein